MTRARAFCIAVCAAVLGGCGDDAGSDPSLQRPAFDLEANDLDFGEVRVGQNRSTDLEVTNTGPVPLTLELVRLGEAVGSIRAQLDPTSLQPGAAADLTVSFSPTEAGPVEASFRLQIVGGDDQAPTAELRIAALGTEPMGIASPTELDFEPLLPGTTSTLSFTLENTGLTAVEVEVLPTTNADLCSFSASQPAPFCVDVPDNTIVPLEVGERRKIEVTYRPTTADAEDEGTLTVRFCRSGSPGCVYDVRLSGRGTDEDIVCTPESFDFGVINPGVCAGINLDCVNESNRPVQMLRAELTSNTAREYLLQGSLPSTVPARGSAQLSVLYCPTEVGVHTGGLVITSTREGRNVRQDTFPFTGQGGGPDVLADRRIDYGTVSTLAPARRVVRVQNLGSADLDLERVEIAVSPGAGWIVLTQTPLVVPPSGTTDVEIEVQAMMEGPLQATASLISNDRDTPTFNVQLTARGATLPPCVYSTDLPEAGPIEIRAEVNGLTTRSFEIRNEGRATCQVTAIQLRSPTDSTLTLVGTNRQSHAVAPGGTSRIAVRFAPREAGSARADLFIGTSSPDEPFVTVPVVATTLP